MTDCDDTRSSERAMPTPVSFHRRSSSEDQASTVTTRMLGVHTLSMLGRSPRSILAMAAELLHVSTARGSCVPLAGSAAFVHTLWAGPAGQLHRATR